MTEEKDVREYTAELQELFNHLDLTVIQATAANIILQRMSVGESVANLRHQADSAKAHANREKYLRLEVAKLDGRLDGSNTDARKLAKELVIATDGDILAAEESVRGMQAAYSEAESVYSNLYHLYEVLIEAVKNENV